MHSSHISRPLSAIIAASSVFEGPDLGELPDWVLEWMELPEPVKLVRLGDKFMFHWSQNPPGGLRADTATYQWLAKVARDAVSNPYAICRQGAKRFRIIQTADPLEIATNDSQYLPIRHVVFPMKYVPSSNARPPELFLITWIPLSSEKAAQKYLRNARIRGS